jgi:hypothetical protein
MRNKELPSLNLIITKMHHKVKANKNLSSWKSEVNRKDVFQITKRRIN